MEYELHSHRYGLEIIENSTDFKPVFDGLLSVIKNLNEEEFLISFESWLSKNPLKKSVSTELNRYFDENLVAIGWDRQSEIFKDPRYHSKSDNSPWKLDFSFKELFSLEVAFNHAGSTMANLIKPVLASELNHVEKKFQTKIGIVITATQDFRKLGGFDPAIGTYEKYLEHLPPLMNQLTVPMVIIGLKPFKTFSVSPKKKGVRELSKIIRNSVSQSTESPSELSSTDLGL